MTSKKAPVRSRVRSKAYVIGYGKPPLETRFKKGQSGNPVGRPKGARGLQTLVLEILQEKVSIRTNGKDRRITTLEALLLKQVELAIKGNPRALEKLILWSRASEPEQAERTAEPTTAELTEADQSILAELEAMLRASSPVDPDDSAEGGE